MINLNLELMRYQRLSTLGRDLGGFVHNAAGPLNIIIGYIQVLKSKYQDEKGFKKIWEASLELDRMLKDIGSHIEEVELDLDKKINLNELVLRHLELLRANNYYKHNIEAVADLEEDLPLLKGNYGDIMLCLDALLSNAIEAVKDSAIKKIVVRTKLEKSENKKLIKLTVRDTGDGIEEEKRDKYFEFGYSNWHTHNVHRKGIGLGLIKYILERSGNEINLGNSCGCGAEVSIVIPLRDKDEI